MAKQVVNLGVAPTGQGGDTPRSANVKIAANFDEVYAALGAAGSPQVLPAALPVAQGGTGSTAAAGARANLGLGDSAIKNVGTAAGQVMGVGAGGLLGQPPTVSNFHNLGATEFRSAYDAANQPPGGIGVYSVVSIRPGAEPGWVTMLAQEVNGYRLAFKCVKVDQSAATNWSVIYHTNNTTRAADGTLKAI